MASTIDLLKEARKRGLLPPEKMVALEEFEKRGLDNPDSAGVDAAKSFGVGAAEGAIGVLGLPGNLGNAMLAVSDFVAEKLGVEPPSAEARKQGQILPNLLPSGGDIQGAVEGVTGEFRTPQTTAGEFARTAGQFLPGALAPGSLASRALTVAAPAVGSEAAGQLTEGTPFEGAARFGGAIAGALTPGALARAVTPLPNTAVRQAAVDTLKKEGVKSVTAGQATGRKGLQAFEAQKGGSSTQNLLENQAEEFTQAILKKVGSTEKRATPQVVDDLFTTIGKEFDDLAAKSSINVTQGLKDKVTAIRDEFLSFSEVGRQVPFIEKVSNQLLRVQTGRNLTGAQYQKLKTELDKAARLQSGQNNAASDALRELRMTLDDSVESWLKKNRPSDVGRWQKARTRYRNMLVVERAAAGAGEAAAQGLIGPRQLRAGIQRVEGIRGRVRGKSEFDELQRAGEIVLPPLPDSGTARNIRAGSLGVDALPAAVGGTIGSLVGGAPGAGVGAILGASTPGTLARLAVSRPGRAALGNQVLSQSISGQRNLRRALIGGGLELNRAP